LDAGTSLDIAADAALDAAGDHPASVDGSVVDTGSQPIDSSAGIDGSAIGLVIPAAGEKFSPALPDATSLPTGVWYCDMGTVHWAQGDEGSGKCPICGMHLVKKV
jgi:hypothetical protein